ncbi:MAG: DUF6159 family protein [Candidatus Thalassarchaeaceae archaeon]
MMMRRGRPKMGFRATIGRGWRVTKLGMHVVRADPELMAYMLFSGILSLIAAIVLQTTTGGLGYFIGGEEGSEGGAMVGTFLSYMAIAIITVFWNAAIIASAHERLTAGTNPSFSYGIKQAMKCLPQIVIWGLISGTVGLIIRALESIRLDSKNPGMAIVGGIISLIIRVSWWITTFFVVPMIVLDKISIGESMSKSPELFGQTWGEDVVSTTGTGIINFLVCLLIVVIGLPLGVLLGEVLGFLLVLVGIGVSVLFFSACEAVNRASLYYFAKTGESPPLAQKYGIYFANKTGESTPLSQKYDLDF